MRHKLSIAFAIVAAFVAGLLFMRSESDVQAGCSNNPYRSGLFRLTPGVQRTLQTFGPNSRLVITSVTSGAFASASLPSLEFYSGSVLVGVVPGKCDSLGWHFETHFAGIDAQGGFNLPGGQPVGVRLVADSGPSVPVSVSGLVYACNLSTTRSQGFTLDRDVLVPIGNALAGQIVVVRAVTSAPFEVDPGATLQPSLEIFAGGNLVGVVPAQCTSRGWSFETTYPFVTGIVIEPDNPIQATIRNASPAGGPVAVSFVLMSVPSP